MSLIREVFAKNLEEFRKKKQLTQQQLADLVGVTRQSIARYESGTGGATLDTITRLAQVLEIEETDLIAPQKTPEKVELKKQDWTQITELLSQLKTEPPIPEDILNDLAKLDPAELETAWDMVRLSIKGYRDLKKRRSESA